MKMEQIECSEMSAYKIQTPGNHPEENIQHTEHGESLKSKIWTTFPRVLISSRAIYIFLEPLRNTQLSKDMQQTQMWSKLSPPDYRHLTLISSMMRYKPWCHSGSNA
jgi:hypothetical protein